MLTLIVDEFPSGQLTDAFAPNGRIAVLSADGSAGWENGSLPMTYDAAVANSLEFWVALIRERAIWKCDQDGVPWQKIHVGGYPCSLQQLANGHLLAAGWDDDLPGFVREYDEEGQLIWQLEGLVWPWKAERLANGNTLVSDAGTGSVFEVDSDGRTVWQVVGLGPENPTLFDNLGPVYCQRLDTGNTLVSIRGLSKVVELDPAGSIIWQLPDGLTKDQYSAIRLPNGNTLIADNGHNRVIEVDAGANIVWEVSGFGYIAKAYRL